MVVVEKGVTEEVKFEQILEWCLFFIKWNCLGRFLWSIYWKQLACLIFLSLSVASKAVFILFCLFVVNSSPWVVYPSTSVISGTFQWFKWEISRFLNMIVKHPIAKSVFLRPTPTCNFPVQILSFASCPHRISARNTSLHWTPLCWGESFYWSLFLAALHTHFRQMN